MTADIELALSGVPDTLPASLARAAALAGPEEAMVCAGRRITFADLAARVDAVAAALAAHGVRHGDHVGICLGNGIDWVTLFFALGRIGAVTVPVNTRLKTDEIAYTLRQSDVSLLFVADQFLGIDFVAMLRAICPAIDGTLPDPALPALRGVVVLGDQVPAGAVAFARFLAGGADRPVPAPAVRHDDTLLIQYTSGTTSFPKGVMLSHRNMLWDGWCAGRRFGLRAGDRYLSPRPFFHVAGSTLSVLAALQHTACLVSLERFEAGEALRLAEEERCTLFSGNDTLFLTMLGHPDLATCRLHFRGGWVAASPAVVERAIRALGVREVVCAYGLSEASPNVTMSSWWEPEAERIGGWMAPQPGLEVRIVDTETRAPCPPGTPGEIQVRGWSVMKGYYNKPEETAKALSADGWLSTGDLGRMREDGRLAFVGRAKDIIRVGGENVAMADIENTLHRHPAIRQAQVVGVPDPRLVEVPAAFVILAEGAAATPEEIVAWSREHMAGFKVPRHVRIVASFEEIGMTASSKVQKRHLAEHARRILGLDAPSAA